MAKEFFKNFPNINYTLFGNTRNIKNISLSTKIRDIIKSNIYVYYTYEVKDEETIEIVANNYYDDPNYFWLIALANDIHDTVFDWVLDYRSLQSWIDDKYEINYKYANQTGLFLENGRTDTEIDVEDPSTFYTSGLNYAYRNFKYFTNSNIEIDYDTFLRIGGYSKRYYDYEVDLNEAKRNIKLIGKEYLPQINKEISLIFE